MVDAKIRALVVDDERLARKDLTSMLADFPEIAVVGEAQDVPSAIKAIERAFKIKPSEQTIKLRKIMNLAQLIHSHALHLFFLSLPIIVHINLDV